MTLTLTELKQEPLTEIIQEIQYIQEKDRKQMQQQARLKAKEEERKISMQQSGIIYVVKCMYCLKEICTSDQISKCHGMHRVLVKEGFQSDFIFKLGGTITMHSTVELVGRALCICGKPKAIIGNIMKLDGVPLLVLKTENIRICNRMGNPVVYKAKYKWKDVPFDPKDIDTADIPEFAYVNNV